MERQSLMDGVEFGHSFCGNPECVLHVRVGDPGVTGSGHWAVLSSGITLGRGLYDGRYLCDRCGRERLAGRVPDAMGDTAADVSELPCIFP
jgi:hypothetical protein